MKKMLSLLLTALLFSTSLYAQAGIPGTLTQQAPTMLNAILKVNTGQGTAQQTLTLQPASSAYVYLIGFTYEACWTTAPTAALTNITSTNLQNTPKWQGAVGLTVTGATWGCDKVAFTPATPVKSNASGTAVTLVTNAAITNVTYNITAYWYEAP
jgi:hypothetical protein